MYRTVVDLVSTGQLDVPVDHTYPLQEHVAALERAARYERPGKVLFVPPAAP